MKKIKFVLLLVLASITISCSDTTAIKNIPDNGSSTPPISGYFKQNVLLEDYTGTWCGNCTRVPYAVEKFKEFSDKIVEVAIHNQSNDPYKLDGTPFFNQLVQLIAPGSSVLSLPKAYLNRTTKWTAYEYLNLDQALSLTGNNSGLGLAMSPTILNGNINIDVKMKFVQNYSDLKLVVVLLENNLIHDQVNYNTFVGTGEYVFVDYVHNDVLRAPLTDILGDSLTGTTTGQTITKNFSLPIPTNITNANNISFAAFIVGSDNAVLNARACHLNENQVFEQNP